jgi:PAS domain S-box-containing protein
MGHIDMMERQSVDPYMYRWFALLVAGADDAIIGISLRGTIASWNYGAERLLGYTEAEVLDAPLGIIAANDDILHPLPGGACMEPHHAVFQQKGGGKVVVSVITSAIHDDNTIIGVSIIARKLSSEALAQPDNALIIAEMHHRIRNLFTLVGSVVALSARFAASPADLARRVRGRLVALSRTNDLTLSGFSHRQDARNREIKLHSLINAIVTSYGEPSPAGDRQCVVINGPDLAITKHSITHLALLLNELATNAAKYGALSYPSGMIIIDCTIGPVELSIVWRERGGPQLDDNGGTEGFGSQFSRTVMSRHLGGTMTRSWTREGLVVRFAIPLANLQR